ncbi:MAG: hypothetical protein IJB10_01400 [Clostridia bacterium]|nr:hypothetical protein [Clostridia bacterium]
MNIFESMWGLIRANFFYDVRSTIVSICFLLGVFFFMKLLKYDGEKIFKSMRYLTCVVLFFSVAFILR